MRQNWFVIKKWVLRSGKEVCGYTFLMSDLIIFAISGNSDIWK
jgi:hypothetical protein